MWEPEAFKKESPVSFISQGNLIYLPVAIKTSQFYSNCFIAILFPGNRFEICCYVLANPKPFVWRISQNPSKDGFLEEKHI